MAICELWELAVYYGFLMNWELFCFSRTAESGVYDKSDTWLSTVKYTLSRSFFWYSWPLLWYIMLEFPFLGILWQVWTSTQFVHHNTYHGVMGYSDTLQQGMGCLRTDGAQYCTRHLFPNSSFPTSARASMKHLSLRLELLHSVSPDSEKKSKKSRLLSNIFRFRYCKIKQLKHCTILILYLNS